MNKRQNPANTRPRGKPRGLRRDRDCASCKLRNVKCDLNRPKCLPCTQSELPCGDYPQRVVWASSRIHMIQACDSKTKGPTGSYSNVKEVPNGFSRSTLFSPGTLSEYPDRTVSTVKVDHNSFFGYLSSFCHRITRAAQFVQFDESQVVSSETVRLVSTVCNFVQTSSSPAPLFGHDCPENEEAASGRIALLSCLNKTLQTANPFSILGIAAFAMFEVCNGPFGQWQHHIIGAKSLLDHHCRSRTELFRLSQTVTGLVDIVSRLVWFDVCGTLARQQPSGLILDDWHRSILHDNFFRLVGCPSDCFDLWIQTAKGAVASDPLRSCIQAMGQLSKIGSDNGNNYSHCADACRCAAAIVVLTRIDDETTDFFKRPSLSSAVNRLCQILDSSSTSSPYHAFMALPAYLAGMEASTSQQCATLRNYWQDCRLAGVHRYPGALEGCEAIWKSKGLV